MNFLLFAGFKNLYIQSVLFEIQIIFRDHGATLRLGGGGGAPLVIRYWGGGAQDTFSN